MDAQSSKIVVQQIFMCVSPEKTLFENNGNTSN